MANKRNVLWEARMKETTKPYGESGKELNCCILIVNIATFTNKSLQLFTPGVENTRATI